MDKWEKVIGGLECCNGEGLCIGEKCPYYEDEMCVETLHSDALALKAQEPRVMTLEEVIESKSAFWLEFREEDNDDCIRYGWAFFSGSTPDVIEVIVRDSFRPINAFIACEYGERWRCWTSRPDEKRRAETPWE